MLELRLDQMEGGTTTTLNGLLIQAWRERWTDMQLSIVLKNKCTTLADKELLVGKIELSVYLYTVF